MAKTEQKEVIEDAKIDSVNVDLTNLDLGLILDSLDLMIANLKSNNPNATVSILNLAVKLKEAIK